MRQSVAAMVHRRKGLTARKNIQGSPPPRVHNPDYLNIKKKVILNALTEHLIIAWDERSVTLGNNKNKVFPTNGSVLSKN